MAQLDLSNAHITPIFPPANDAGYLFLASSNFRFFDVNGQQIASGSGSILVEQTSNFKVYYSGSFTASGTEFYIGKLNTQPVWRVSGVSFSVGDTYAFTIRADIILNQ